MFTGIVEEIGTVVNLETVGDLVQLTIQGPLVITDSHHGSSIAVNGVCLTVTDETGRTGETFSVDVMGETLARTSLGSLQPGSPVNLERAMSAQGRFSGHVVQGHVDGVATLTRRTVLDGWETMRFVMPQRVDKYVVEKGSITVDGVSLTVASVSEVGAGEPWFEVALIPTTLRKTTLGGLEVGARVNLELDVMAKYLERFSAYERANHE